jgi:hypothetical protein
MISHALPVAAAFVAYAIVMAFESRRAQAVALLALMGSQALVTLDFTARRSVAMPLWTGLEQFERYGLKYGASEYSYFDRTNRDLLRNLPVVDQLDRIIGELLLGHRDQVRLAAHQMGFTPYYLTQEHFRRVRFFDLNGLTDRLATDAAVFASAEREIYGVAGLLSRILQDRTALESDPDFVAPDLIVYQFYTRRIPTLQFENSGYSVIYAQTGPISTGSRNFPGRTVLANQLIAIRRELLPELGNTSLIWLPFHKTGTVRANSAW